MGFHSKLLFLLCFPDAFLRKKGKKNMHKSCSRASTGQASDLIRPRVSLQSLVFLRNSRHPLSSATIYGLPSTKGTGVICRVPSPEFALSLSFLNQSTCGGFEYGLKKDVFPAEQMNLQRFMCVASVDLKVHTLSLRKGQFSDCPDTLPSRSFPSTTACAFF